MIRLAQGDKVKKVRIFRAWFSQSSLLKSELESELSLLDSGELSCFIFVSPVATWYHAMETIAPSFSSLSWLGGSSGTGTGVS